MNTHLADVFGSLFRGRVDIWFDCRTNRRGLGPLREEMFAEHLAGGQPIGVYNLLPDSTVIWSATDIDQDEPEWVDRLVRTWDFYGVRAWAERSRSKGWHVWVFHPEPIPALHARQAWLWVHELCEVPATEVYPKQVSAEGTYGNCIRLPLNRNREEGKQTFYEDDLETPITESDFLTRAITERDTPSEGYRQPDQELMGELSSNYSFETMDGGNAVAVRLVTDGGMNQDVARVYAGQASVPAGSRDNTFWCLACFIAGRGHTEQEAEAIITSVYTKQTDRDGYSLDDALAKIPRAFELVGWRKTL